MRPAARFRAVFRTGVASRAGGITVLHAPASTGPPQVGIVAARRVGNAVRRNRAKRRLREAMMKVDLQVDTAYVVIASPNVVTMSFDDLTRRLREAVEAGRDGDER